MAKNHQDNTPDMMQCYHHLYPEDFLFPQLAIPVGPHFAIYKTLPQSPATPSPSSAQQLKFLLHRLSEIDTESRALLKELFSMLQKEAKLEKYMRKKLENPKVSHIWELVEQVLESQQGMPIDFNALMSNPRVYRDKGVQTDCLDGEMSTKLERFKIKTLGGDVLLDIDAKSTGNSNSGSK